MPRASLRRGRALRAVSTFRSLCRSSPGDGRSNHADQEFHRLTRLPKAFVTLKPGRTLGAEELLAYLRTRLPGFKRPRAVDFGELPKTSTGKVQKFVLRDRE